MCQSLGGGKLSHIVKHPNNPVRPLHRNLDYCHIIKNVRSIFLNEKRFLSVKGKYVSSSYVKRLHELQKNEVVKPVRFLSRKHVYATSMEKMNVKRAIQIFSPPVTAAISFLDKKKLHTKVRRQMLLWLL